MAKVKAVAKLLWSTMILREEEGVVIWETRVTSKEVVDEEGKRPCNHHRRYHERSLPWLWFLLLLLLFLCYSPKHRPTAGQ